MPARQNRLFYLIFVTGFAFVTGASSKALGEEFYSGKTLRFIVGYSAGEVLTSTRGQSAAT